VHELGVHGQGVLPRTVVIGVAVGVAAASASTRI
jgi:hypothetical protein